jgi:hypothetical protein
MAEVGDWRCIVHRAESIVLKARFGNPAKGFGCMLKAVRKNK